MIYGTNISSKNVMGLLEKFVLEYEQTFTVDEETHNEKVYYRQLMELDMLESTTFNVRGSHIKEYDPEIYYQFVYFPA